MPTRLNQIHLERRANPCQTREFAEGIYHRYKLSRLNGISIYDHAFVEASAVVATRLGIFSVEAPHNQRLGLSERAIKGLTIFLDREPNRVSEPLCFTVGPELEFSVNVVGRMGIVLRAVRQPVLAARRHPYDYVSTLGEVDPSEGVYHVVVLDANPNPIRRNQRSSVIQGCPPFCEQVCFVAASFQRRFKWI